MITGDGYFDWALRNPALPESHRWYEDTPVDIVVCHSLEGSLAGGYWAFLDPNMPPWKGWHWTVGRDGKLYQHAPIWWGLAHGNDANDKGPGGESEGFAGEPLTPEQVATWRRILRDLETWKGRPYTRLNGKLTEHREWGDTACPSGRYEPLYEALRAEKGDGDMADPEAREMARLAQRRVDRMNEAFIDHRFPKMREGIDKLQEGLELLQEAIADEVPEKAKEKDA